MYVPKLVEMYTQNGWISLYINYTPIELVEKRTNCLRHWGKIHYNSLRGVNSHTGFQTIIFL